MLHFFFIICTWTLFGASMMNDDEPPAIIFDFASGRSHETCYGVNSIISANRESLYRKFSVSHHDRAKKTTIMVPDNFLKEGKSCITLQRAQQPPEIFAEITILPQTSIFQKLTVSARPSEHLHTLSPILECTLKCDSQTPGTIVAETSGDFLTLRIKPPFVKPQHYEVHIKIHILPPGPRDDDFSFTSCSLQIFDPELRAFTPITSVHIEKTLVASVIHEAPPISPDKEGLGTQDGSIFDVIAQKLFHLYGANRQPQSASRHLCPSQDPSRPGPDDIQERLSALKELLQKAQERGTTSPPHIQHNTLMHGIEAGLLTLTKSLTQLQEQEQHPPEGHHSQQRYHRDAQENLRGSFDKLRAAFLQLQQIIEIGPEHSRVQ